MSCTRLGVAALLVASACRAGGASQSAPASPSIDLPFEAYTLDNGLDVILHVDHRLPLVAVSVWYDVGALHERPGRSGFAHLFEHMMFQGSGHVPEDQHFRILQSVGATGLNGTTSFDRTNYFETVPANALETALWLESDRMGFLLEAVTEASLANQIDVVQNERRQSVVNRPYGLMDEQLTQALFPAPHPYFGNVIGSMDDIAAASLEDVQAFFRTYYTPANATLTLAGDFEPEEAKALVAKYFGTLTGSLAPERVVPPAPVLEEERVIAFTEGVGKLEKLSVAWIGPPAFSEGTAALDVLAHIISGVRSSRLDRKVSFEDPMAQSVTAYFQEHLSASVFQIDIVLKPGRTADEALAAVDEVLAGFEKVPPMPGEVERAKNAWESSTLRRLQQLGGFGGRAEVLQSYKHYTGTPDRLAWDVARHREIGVDDVERALEWLRAPRVVMLARPAADVEGDAP